MRIFNLEFSSSKANKKTDNDKVRTEPNLKVIDTKADTVTTTTTKDVSGVSNFSFPPNIGWSNGWMPSNTGEPVTHWTALQHSVAYACVKAVSSDMAVLPLNLERHKDGARGSQTIRNHPVVDLLREPNPWQTNFKFMACVISNLVLRGNAFVWIRRANDGTPMQLIPLLNDRVVVLRNLENPGHLIYQFTSSAFAEEFFRVGEEDMLHVSNAMSFDDGGILGASPITHGQQTIGLALAVSKSCAVLFRQGAQIRGVLKTAGKLGAALAERIATSWNQVYSGNDNAHRVAVLEEGLDFVPVSLTAKDAQMIEARAASDEEVCRMFGVPQHRAGILTRSTFSNIEQQFEEYYQCTLLPIAVSIEQEFQRKLLFKDERRDMFFKIDFNMLLRSDTKTQFDVFQIAFLNGFMSQNEIRAKLGMNPIPDGDIYYHPLNSGPAAKPTDSSPEATTPAQPDPSTDTDTDDDNDKVD